MDTTLASMTRIDAFFDQLTNRGRIEALNHVSGTVELDIEDFERRWLIVHQGNVRVSQTPTAADCVLACDAETFIGIASGRVNFVAASLRGAVTVSGDLALAIAMRRLGRDSNGRK
jgi:putative sterol carrier protein